MTVYAIALIKIKDRDEYEKYSARFMEWATSPEYLEIAKHRVAGADVTTVLAEAIAG